MYLRTLGGLRLEGTTFRKPKPLLLLAYLVLEGPTERRHLAELFWPRAANHLNSLAGALSQLRALDRTLVADDDGRLRAAVDSDVVELEGALERGDDARALDLYRAPLLEGVHLRTWGAELEEWVVARRERLARRLRGARLRLAEAAIAAERPEDSRRHAEAAYTLAAAPPPEPGELRRLARLLAGTGSALLAELRRDAAELGVELSTDTTSGSTPSRAPGVAPLPQRGTSFVGRDLEIAEAGEMLRRADCRLLSIVGAGGIGKTRLALEVASELATHETYHDGVAFAPLEGANDVGAAVSAIARRIGLVLGGADDPTDQLLQRLRRCRLLLVLDNCEHLPLAPLVARLLAACPGIDLLVTSRRRLYLEEEWLLPLGGLAFPDAEIPLSEARTYDSVRLFEARARRGRGSLPVGGSGDGEQRAIVELCALVEGAPLAIELAASWVDVLPVREIAAAIGRNVGELETRMHNVPARHRSIHATLEHSWTLLDSRLREHARALAVFRDGFDLDAADRVAGVLRADLASLVDASLVRGPVAERYDLHPLVHRFLVMKLEQRPAVQRALHGRHREHYLTTLQGWRAARDPLRPEKIAALEIEIGNILAAWRRLVETGCDGVSGAVEALTWYFEVRAEYHAGIAELDAAIAELGPEVPEPDEAACREALGHLLVARAWLGHWLENERAERWADRGLALLRPFGDVVGIVLGLRVKGIIAWRRGRYPAAERAYRDAAALARATGSEALEATVLDGLGLALACLGRYQEARRCHVDALAINDRLGTAFQQVHNLAHLSALARRSGSGDDPLPLAQRALTLARDIDFRQYLPYCLVEVALAQAHSGEAERAAETARDALVAAEAIGDVWTEAGTLRLLGRLAIDAGDPRGARRLLERSVAIAWEARDRSFVLRTLFEAARLERAVGAPDRATRWLHQLVADPALPDWTAREARALLGGDREMADAARDRSGGSELLRALREAFPGVIVAPGGDAAVDDRTGPNGGG